MHGKARQAAAQDWMRTAVKPENKGKFKRKAEDAGMSTQAYAKKVTGPGSKASTKTKRQANLTKVFHRYRNA
jgi:hypothetical protein